jgi:tRNA-splicing ligase RtcB
VVNLPHLGVYDQFAILSHFGSRSIGSTIANVYSKLARDKYEVPRGIHSVPLSMLDDDGHDYFALMNWAGRFAESSHDWLHRNLLLELEPRLKTKDLINNVVFSAYSMHNFAWKTKNGIIHRKGATPAHKDQYGVIPATMGESSKIVIGLGNEKSLNSASHGAGRLYSRTQASQQFRDTHRYVKQEYNVTLIGGDVDEDPRAYKRIKDVMKYQTECVKEIGEFQPYVVRMAEPRLPYWKTKKQ